MAIRRLSRQHARIANVRQTFLHAVSSQLIQTHDRLCLEDLAVANLLSNRYLAGAIADAAWTDFPSSKTCSQCGKVHQQLGLAERIFRCDACGLIADRDRNAAAWPSASTPRFRTAKRAAG